MQSDFYCSPCQTVSPCQDSGVTERKAKRARRKGGRLALILFLTLIVLSVAALIVIRIVFPGDQAFSPEDIISQFDRLDPFFQNPDDGFDDFFAPDSNDSAPTTIPRCAPNPNIQLHLNNPPAAPMSFQDIYEKTLPSIVIVNAYGDTTAATGTGVVMTADGYVITNHHIIAGCSSAEVVLSDGTQYNAELAGSDVESDLAILKINAQDLTPAEFGNSDRLRVGDTVLAIGNPLGSELFGTMTEGIISAINRNVNVDGYNKNLLQTTAALNTGNSGGALLNNTGQVIGITNLKMMSDYNTIEGLGFAIPTVWAKEVIDELLANGAITGRPTIGITCYAIAAQDAAYFGQDFGIYIQTVTNKGPADKAGIRPGDILLTANGVSLYALEDLTVLRDEAGVGGSLDLTVWRKGETFSTTLILIDQHELN